MKPSKQLESTRIADNREYVEELGKLSRLNSALEAASRRLEALTTRRPSGEVGRYLGKCPNALAGVSETLFDDMAIRVSAEGEISEQLAQRLRVLAPEVPLSEEYDRLAVQEIFEVDRGVRLFKRAIVLQSKRVLDRKNKLVGRICG